LTCSDDSKTEHGLVSLAPIGGDSAVLVWLDGRDGKTTRLMRAVLARMMPFTPK